MYESDKYADSDSVQASKRMLKSAGVSLRQSDKKVQVNVSES